MSVDDALGERVRAFVAEWSGVKAGVIDESTRLSEDLRLYGDDIHELVAAFGEAFEVDVGGYRWHQHSGPEGCNPLWLLRKPWWAREEQIPIRVGDLVASARAGTWTIRYPAST